jgi:hypothetical protein
VAAPVPVMMEYKVSLPSMGLQEKIRVAMLPDQVE